MKFTCCRCGKKFKVKKKYLIGMINLMAPGYNYCKKCIIKKDEKKMEKII